MGAPSGSVLARAFRANAKPNELQKQGKKSYLVKIQSTTKKPYMRAGTPEPEDEEFEGLGEEE